MILRVIMNHGEIPFHYMCQSDCLQYIVPAAYLRFRYCKLSQLDTFGFGPITMVGNHPKISLIFIPSVPCQLFFSEYTITMSPCIKHI